MRDHLPGRLSTGTAYNKSSCEHILFICSLYNSDTGGIKWEIFHGSVGCKGRSWLEKTIFNRATWKPGLFSWPQPRPLVKMDETRTWALQLRFPICSNCLRPKKGVNVSNFRLQYAYVWTHMICIYAICKNIYIIYVCLLVLSLVIRHVSDSHQYKEQSC